jgi:hypothetical protein
MSDQKPISNRVSISFSRSSSRSSTATLLPCRNPITARFGANPGLAHGVADQRGFGRQDHLRRGDLLGAVDEVVSDLAERSRRQSGAAVHPERL